MPSYTVACCRIEGSEINRVRQLPNFDRMVLELRQNTPGNLQINRIYAADAADQPLPNGVINFAAAGSENINLANNWIPADLKVSEAMLRKVSNGHNPPKQVDHVRFFRVRKYRHNQPGHPQHNREFVGYKVKVKHT